MRPQEQPFLSPAQYLEQEREAEFKSEYLAGDIFAMAEASREHKQISSNIVVACEPQQFEDAHTDVLLNPTVIMEILSDSTEAYDRGLKFIHYQCLESLREYLLISQKLCLVEHYQRQAGKLWTYSAFRNRDDRADINALRRTLSLKDIYRKVALADVAV